MLPQEWPGLQLLIVVIAGAAAQMLPSVMPIATQAKTVVPELLAFRENAKLEFWPLIMG